MREAGPTSEEVVTARTDLGMSMRQAAEIVHTTMKTWQQWEYGTRQMHPAFWELFLLKTGKHSLNLIAA